MSFAGFAGAAVARGILAGLGASAPFLCNELRQALWDDAERDAAFALGMSGKILSIFLLRMICGKFLHHQQNQWLAAND